MFSVYVASPIFYTPIRTPGMGEGCDLVFLFNFLNTSYYPFFRTQFRLGGIFLCGTQVNFSGWNQSKFFWVEHRSIFLRETQVNFSGWNIGQFFCVKPKSIFLGGTQVNFPNLCWCKIELMTFGLAVALLRRDPVLSPRFPQRFSFNAAKGLFTFHNSRCHDEFIYICCCIIMRNVAIW